MLENKFSPASSFSFKEFLLKDHFIKKLLLFSFITAVFEFAIFKYLYPHANFIHGDSFAYLLAAEKNLTINTYPIGYSKFLRIFSVFAKPDIVLVTFQYLLIILGALALLFSVFYFYKIRKPIQIILSCFVILNPLLLHLGNMVSSDGVFLSLSLIWFALLLWIIYKPSNKIIIWHALILFLAFIVRYNAIIYPFFALLAFWLSNMPIRNKIVGVSLFFLLCGWFVGLTMYQYKQLTGYWQFSPFSGWQLANNALYAYRYVDSEDIKGVPAKFQKLDDKVHNFYYRSRGMKIFFEDGAKASTLYMWSRGMPLMTYRDSLFKAREKSAGEFKKWASMGPFYKDYGLYLIKKYPSKFAQYFLLPNARKYYAPPIEFLEIYNSGRDNVTDQARVWFGYKSDKLDTRTANGKIWVLNYYPILSGIINVVMFFGLIYFIILKGWTYNSVFNKAIILTGSFWLCNACFTIFASSVALRFQAFPILLTTIFSFLLIGWMAELFKKLRTAEEHKFKTDFSTEAIA